MELNSAAMAVSRKGRPTNAISNGRPVSVLRRLTVTSPDKENRKKGAESLLKEARERGGRPGMTKEILTVNEYITPHVPTDI